MGELVAFPRKNRRRAQKAQLIISNRLCNFIEHDAAAGFDFTCAICNNKSHIEFKNAIMKQFEFYCSACGTGYKLDNPSLSNKLNRRSR